MMLKEWQLYYPEFIQDWAVFEKVVLDNRQLDWQKEKELYSLDKISAKGLGIDKAQLKTAIKKILSVRNSGQEVVIFGDYDVDGNCATAILWQGLKEIGITATPFIPHRLRHGYGLKVAALEEVFAVSKPDLLITVDNGIVAHEALEFCAQEKVAVIVTDHHLSDKEKFPSSVLASIHTTKLCGAGVAWFLVRELWRQAEVKNWPVKTRELLDLVCLATVADQVSLTGFNRQLVRVGLEQLRQTQRPGLLALMKISSLSPEKLSTTDIGFALGPKINAIGRLTNTLEALRLLCTNNPRRARDLAQTLLQVNHQRQDLTEELFALAQKQVESQPLTKIILVASDKFHEGVVGLIASRLVDIYHRPSIAIALRDKIGKASCRSVEGINITALLRQFREEMIDLGGHEMAAGFSCWREKVNVIKKHLITAGKKITAQQLRPRLFGDATIDLSLLYHKNLPKFINQLEPFGTDNPPLLVRVVGKVFSWRYLGSEQQHLRLDLRDEQGLTIPILFWQFSKKKISLPQKDEQWEVLGEIKIDEYAGQLRPQLFAQDGRVLAE